MVIAVQKMAAFPQQDLRTVKIAGLPHTNAPPQWDMGVVIMA